MNWSRNRSLDHITFSAKIGTSIPDEPCANTLIGPAHYTAFRLHETMNLDVIARPAPNSFRRDVEGLRGVAVLLVVGCHCDISWCAGGFVGVDIFFVLSGYLITGLLAAEYRCASRLNLLEFYARRVRRLLPSCVIVLATTTLFAAAFLSPQEMRLAGQAARWAGLYASNLYFDRNAADYFASNVENNPLLHTWSLGLEEQFYLVWPLLILVALRGARRLQRVITVLTAVTILSYIYCISTTRMAPTVAFYELPARAWEFAAGGLLAFLPTSGKSNNSRWAVALGFFGLLAVLAACLFVKGGAAFPGWIALLPVSGTLAILLAGVNAPKRGVSAFLSASPLQFIGSRSYGWYLWHWPFLVFASILYPGITSGGKVLAASASLLAAGFTYRVVERPIRDNAYLTVRPQLSLSIALCATAIIVSASSILIVHGNRQLAMDETFRSIGAASNDIADISISACVSQGPSLRVNTCAFGSSDTNRTIVLFGDSHAIQWFNAVRNAAAMAHWRLVTVFRFGCAASDINPHQLSSLKNECSEWRARALQAIVAMHPSAVIMASYTGATIRGFRAEQPMSTEELRLGTRRTLERLSSTGVPIVLLRDTPLPPFDIPQCVARNALKVNAADACNFDASAAMDEKAFYAERSAAEGLHNIYFLDMSDLICPGSSCPAMLHGLIVYRDDNHLTGTFAGTLAQTLRTRLFGLFHD